MPNRLAPRFESLLQMILEDDQDEVRHLLEQEPALATLGAGRAVLDPRLAHWIYTGDSALHVAAAAYRVETGRMLLRAGANGRLASPHRHSEPLHYAANGHPQSPSWDPAKQVGMIQLLIQAGGRVNAQDKNGATPLHLAVRTRCAAAVLALLDAGADPARRNRSGSTPFHLAVQNTGRGGSGQAPAKAAQREIIEAFLERGISPTCRDGKGNSVFAQTRSEWIRHLLLAQGGGCE